jgi:endonuclease/exonuclease/phosphatase family metal-dependent hydrolase
MLKGKSLLLKKDVQGDMAQALEELQPDILVLQEFPDNSLVQNGDPQSPTLFTGPTLPYYAYGFNATSRKGRHGNAVLARFPILDFANVNISKTQFAKRGLLHSQLQLPDSDKKLHVFSTHFDLFQKARDQQLRGLAQTIAQNVPKDSPLLFCGDFNDWNRKLDKGLSQAFAQIGLEFQAPPPLVKSFPSHLPVLPLDRIYGHEVHIRNLWVPKGKLWARLSDHRPVVADCELDCV